MIQKGNGPNQDDSQIKDKDGEQLAEFGGNLKGPERKETDKVKKERSRSKKSKSLKKHKTDSSVETNKLSIKRQSTRIADP
jgi:hypothetical protein